MSDTIPDVRLRVVVPAADVVVEEDGDRLVLHRAKFGAGRTLVLRLLRQETRFTVRLDRRAAAAWRLFDGKRTVADVRAGLGKEFEGDEEVSARLGRLVGVLLSHRMVRLE